MPTGLELEPVDPGNPAELPATAKPGKKILFLSSLDMKFYARDDGGVDELLGERGTRSVADEGFHFSSD